MNDAEVAFAILTLSVLLIFLGFLIWGIYRGQFRDIEEAKYRIFKEGDE